MRSIHPAKPRGSGRDDRAGISRLRSPPRGFPEAPADPGGSVSEFEKICGIISSTKGLNLIVYPLLVDLASHLEEPTG